MAETLSEATTEFGKRLRAHRHAREWSQEDLGEAADLHWTYVGQVERGERNISLRNILKLADALEIDAGELLTALKSW